MRTFTAIIERCSVTGHYVGYVPALPGAHTQAGTFEELHDNLVEVVTLVLEDGDPPARNGVHRYPHDPHLRGRPWIPVPGPRGVVDTGIAVGDENEGFAVGIERKRGGWAVKRNFLGDPAGNTPGYLPP